MCIRHLQRLRLAAAVIPVMSSACVPHGFTESSSTTVPDGYGLPSESVVAQGDSTMESHGPDSAVSQAPADLLLASGTVHGPGGFPCSSATVTLVRDHDQKPRYLTVTTDETGFFAVYGSAYGTSCRPIWAATEDGRLGAAWVPFTSRSPKSRHIEIHLRGGQTVLHVRDKQHKPVADALVDVFLSGIEDMSEPVPPKIREMLKRRTNDKGIAYWPCRLGDYDLGFEVAARGHEVQRQDHYYSGIAKNQYGMYFSRVKVFVLDGDHHDHEACAKMIEAQILRGDYEELSDAPESPIESESDV